MCEKKKQFVGIKEDEKKEVEKEEEKEEEKEQEENLKEKVEDNEQETEEEPTKGKILRISYLNKYKLLHYS